jgi:hypothetical protein
MAFAKHAYEPIEASTLTRSWMLVCPLEASQFKGLQHQAVPALIALEAAGLAEMNQWSNTYCRPGTPQNTLARLGISMASSWKHADGTATSM